VNTRLRILLGIATCGVLVTSAAMLPTAAGAAARTVTSAAHRGPARAGAQPSRSSRASRPAAAPVLGGQPSMAVGTLTGVVRGAVGIALTRACVTASGAARTYSALTGTGGRYVLTGLLPGSYTVSYADCASPGSYFEQWYGGGDLAGGAAPVLVTAGQVTPLVQVTLRPTNPEALIGTPASDHRAMAAAGLAVPARASSSVSGTVTSSSGKKLSGICVLIYTQSAGGTSGTGVSTGRNGRYKFGPDTGGLPNGKWRVEFSGGCGNKGNFAPQWWKHSATAAKATVLRIRSGSRFTGISAALQAGGQIAGIVRADSDTGRPLSGICVTVGTEGIFGTQTQARTRSNGRYLLKGLATGKYHVRFLPSCGAKGNFLSAAYPRKVSVRAGKKTSGVNVFLRPGGEISGVVTTAGSAPSGGICVLADSSRTAHDVVTRKDGSYAIRHLPPGRYTVAFSGGCGNSGSYAPQFYPDETNGAAATPLTISLGQARTGINAQLRPGATVTGRVTNRAGKKLSNICVELLSPQVLGGLGASPLTSLSLGIGGPAESIGIGFTFTERGTYTVRNLAAGLYFADFSSCGSGNLADQWYSAQPDFATASQVSANAGTVTTGIGAVMQPGGTITGLVTNQAGRRLPHFCAAAVNLKDPFSNDIIISVGFPAPNQHGRYRITGLATGTYRVVFLPCFGGAHATQWYKGKASLASATPVHVTSGHVTSAIDGVLIHGEPILGRVTSGETGQPLSGVCVLANDAQGNSVAGGTTGKSGRYILPELPRGTYNLQFFFCDQIGGALAAIQRPGVRVGGTGPTAGINATLRRGGSISGSVLAGTAAMPEPGVCVEVTPKTGLGVPGFAVTGPGGTYLLTGLAPGSYAVLFTADCDFGTALLVPQWYSDSATEKGATLVTVTAGATHTGIGATLTADGGISGTVTGTAHAPLAGACVTATRTGTDPHPVIAVTTSKGNYGISGLAPGSYTVKFAAGCGATGLATQWWQDVSSQNAATPVPVAAGATTAGIDAAMAP
jgi:hypothetical protein